MNMLLLLSFTLVSSTGLLRWMYKPHVETGSLAVILQPVCRLFGIVHRWSGLAFLLLALYHIYIHWDWITRMTEKMAKEALPDSPAEKSKNDEKELLS